MSALQIFHPRFTESLSVERPACKFQGFVISQDEDSYFWQEGGYFDTLQECQQDIADWNEIEGARTDENIYGLASIAQSIAEDS